MKDLILKRCSSTYYDKKHKPLCKNIYGGCYRIRAISGAGFIDYCWCDLGIKVDKNKVVRAILVD